MAPNIPAVDKEGAGDGGVGVNQEDTRHGQAGEGRIEHKQSGSHCPTQSDSTIPDRTKTSASCAIISPKKVILLEKTNIITAGVLRCIPRDKRG